MIRGSCLCAQVRFRIDGPVRELSHCHCSQCRKAYGSAFGTIASVESNHFSYVAGAELIASYRQSKRVTRYFCRNCGSRLPIAEPWDPLVGVPAGLLEGDIGGVPSAHLFVASKASWWEIAGSSAPQYDEWKPGEDFNERFAELDSGRRSGHKPPMPGRGSVVVLLGAPAIGKTSLSRALGEHLRCPHLELSLVPEFREIAGQPIAYELDERIAIQNLVLWARNYLVHGHQFVLLSDFRRESINILQEALSNLQVLPILLVTSQPGLLVERLGARVEGFRDAEAAVAANASWPQVAWGGMRIIDVTGRSIEQLTIDVAREMGHATIG
jgi:hypothetical protein